MSPLTELAAMHRFEFDGFVGVAAIVALVILFACRRRPSRRCPKCLEVNREGALFCAQCGTRLPGT